MATCQQNMCSSLLNECVGVVTMLNDASWFHGYLNYDTPFEKSIFCS